MKFKWSRPKTVLENLLSTLYTVLTYTIYKEDDRAGLSIYEDDIAPLLKN